MTIRRKLWSLGLLVFPTLPTAALASVFSGWFDQGLEAERAGCTGDALEAYRHAGDAALFPAGRSAAANAAGRVLLRARRPADALARFRRAVEHDPSNRVAWLNMGACELHLYEAGLADRAAPDRAVAAYERAAADGAVYRPEEYERAQTFARRERAWADAAAVSPRSVSAAASDPLARAIESYRAAQTSARQEVAAPAAPAPTGQEMPAASAPALASALPSR